MTIMISSSHTVPILDKAIDVVTRIADSDGTESAKSLSAALKIPPATCYRILRTFLRRSWLYEPSPGVFRTGFEFSRLGGSNLSRRLELIADVLHELARNAGVSVKVSIREGDWAVIVFRAESPKPNAISSPVGTRVSLLEGSASAALLEHAADTEIERLIRNASPETWKRQQPDDVWRRIHDVRERGVSREPGQLHPSIHALSMPVEILPDTSAAITLVGWPEDFEDNERQHRLLRASLTEIKKLLAIPGRSASRRNR